MNRRHFLRGTLSVMAVAATLKGRASVDHEEAVLKAVRDVYQSGGRPEALYLPGSVAQDLADVIYDISPHGSPLCDTCGKRHGFHEWVADELKPWRPRHIVRWWDALRSFKRSSDNLDIELGRFDFWSRTYAAALLHAEVNLLRFDLEPIDGSTLAMTASNDNWTRTDHINITNSRLLGTAELDAKKRASIIRLVRKHVRDVHG
jgi:hypothetical protein